MGMIAKMVDWLDPIDLHVEDTFDLCRRKQLIVGIQKDNFCSPKTRNLNGVFIDEYTA